LEGALKSLESEGFQVVDTSEYMHLEGCDAGELGARDLPQLTATELIAAAAAGGVPGVSWADRARLLDSWRKLRNDNLPRHPEKVVMETRERLKREEEERRPGRFNPRRQLALAAALGSRNPSAARAVALRTSSRPGDLPQVE
jgi:hypothetical protein